MQPPNLAVCSRCSREHLQFPQTTFPFPAEVMTLSDSERKSMVEIDGDFCTIHKAGVSERFICCEFIQKIIGRCETVNYLLWVKIGERSYQEYKSSYDIPQTYGSYVGFISNELPYYIVWQNIPVTVYKRDSQKPDIVPHRNVDHPLVKEYYNGIRMEIVQERINGKLKPGIVGMKAASPKPWWKFWQDSLSAPALHGA